MSVATVEGDIIRTTDEAILLAVDGDPDNTIWIPKSVVEEYDAFKDLEEPEDEVGLLIETWFYQKNRKVFDGN